MIHGPRTTLPDPRPARRIKATRAEWEMIRRAKGGDGCRVCSRADNPELHHVVPRSQGGDDVPDNIVRLCVLCHGRIEARHETTALALGLKLTRDERNYVIRKRGLYYLTKRYWTQYPEDVEYQDTLREAA